MLREELNDFFDWFEAQKAEHGCFTFSDWWLWDDSDSSEEILDPVTGAPLQSMVAAIACNDLDHPHPSIFNEHGRCLSPYDFDFRLLPDDIEVVSLHEWGYPWAVLHIEVNSGRETGYTEHCREIGLDDEFYAFMWPRIYERACKHAQGERALLNYGAESEVLACPDVREKLTFSPRLSLAPITEEGAHCG